MTRIHHFQSYVVGSGFSLTRDLLGRLAACFETPPKTADADLGGRAAISRMHLPEIGPVVIKQYTRGGFIRNFNKTTYVKFLRYRSQAEYELLLKLRRLGLNVPEPVAFAVKGRFFYHAWLVTREIQNARTLIDISRNTPEAAQPLMRELNRQVNILVLNHIHHVDLHPGNVLADDKNSLFILDFDKARTCAQNPDKLRQKYIRRWQRAVAKYRLPATLNMDMAKR